LLRVGLTGGVACGKTTVGQMFAARGAHLILADQVAHQLMAPGQPLYDEVLKRFGPEILNPDGSINRARLADAAFGSGRIQELNQIVHPAVMRHQEKAMVDLAARDPGGIAIVEAALILEAGAGNRFDKLIVVTCTPEQRVQRFAERLNMDRAAAEREVARRMAAQWPDQAKVNAADYVIDNSGSIADLEAQMDAVMSELRRIAKEQHSTQPGR
jgi:dephospho-CoA kinase